VELVDEEDDVFGALDLVPVPNTVSNVSLGAIRHFRSTTTTLPGTWDTAPNATVVLDGILIGMTTKLQVRVWDSAEYSSWQDAMNRNGKHGESAIFDYTVPQPGSPGSAFSLENLRAFGVVPEPSVIALAAIGLGALLLRRRK